MNSYSRRKVCRAAILLAAPAFYFAFRGYSRRLPKLWVDFSVKKMSSIDTPVKPPNVLVYTGENQEKVFKNIAVNLLRCLHSDKYVVYELKKAQILKDPWRENVALLVVFCDIIENNITECFENYLESDGKMIVFCSNLNLQKTGLACTASAKDGVIKFKYRGDEDDIQIHHGKYSYSLNKGETLATNTDNKPILIKTKYNEGVLIASEVHLALDPVLLLPDEADSLSKYEDKRLSVLKKILGDELGMELCSFTMPTPTAGCVIIEDSAELSELMKNMKIKEFSLRKPDGISSEKGDTNPQLKVPLLFENQAMTAVIFEKSLYFSRLKTNSFGRVVVFFPVVTSTMIPAEQLSGHTGIVVIANRQISGRGRSDNVWLSPEGCAMFTLHFSLTLTSRLGQRMSIIQHMASLAVVHGIRKIPAFKEFDFRLKWPNDIYFEKDKKIGGVLVNTTIQSDVVHVYIGIGVNVSNQHPTMCINHVIESHNATIGEALPLLKCEEVIALTLTELEYLIDDFTKSGPDNFLSLYYSYWLHEGQRVMLSSLKKEVTILGLDDYGFLIVQTEEGKKITLQPDGNRFDILKNLIVSK